MPPRKAKPPVSEWIIRERKRLGWKPTDVSERLKAAGYEAEVSTVQVWEAGRSPRAETIEALEHIFGSQAPTDTPQAANTEVIAAIRALTAASEAQAAALTAILEEMKVSREATQGRSEGLAAALGDLASTLEQLRPVPDGKR